MNYRNNYGDGCNGENFSKILRYTIHSSFFFLFFETIVALLRWREVGENRFRVTGAHARLISDHLSARAPRAYS